MESLGFAKDLKRSPSVWRVWIEIQVYLFLGGLCASPSVWRVWIEIRGCQKALYLLCQSPSVWRVWIEIINLLSKISNFYVTLRVEGVD